ncbi:MAG: LysM peptidoglycan-binding domain-containing protein [Candidatus Marinimicrobia bacterium]|nr:LysM peptidoglycan-binding domain-containing protein [Candidatus Neomarinimicrobiota bacterium]MBL7023340.1 LysM peptidoglycan-binding domain-containing protein [Candidatus Neomarinimicrobiota bacterium]MBL7109299.1 LysM peptidoglycan-binding domain-containing protein [Candidatus Neomarinimicrobiota bacterium]
MKFYYKIPIILIMASSSVLLGQENTVSAQIVQKVTDAPEHSTQLEIISEDIDTSKIDMESNLFDIRLSEAKSLYAEAIIADITGDTLEASYQFELLFEALSELENISHEDEFQYLEFNRMLTASINYYEENTVTVDKVETGLSVALLRDKLNEYIYAQTLEELEYVEESIEVIPGHIPITYNQKVARIIKFYQNKGRNSVQNWLNRMDRFKAIMLPILEEEGVPPELFYLAMIESGLNPMAYSYAKASGPWQFITSTGKNYGLKKTWWVDERRDFEKSTRSAARYLSDLYKMFDDWYLAFAAYNCGEGRVRKTIKRQGTKDYWKLTRLPGQTRNYVPNIMAAIFIATDPKKYGFLVQSESHLEWKTVKIDKSVSFEVLSNCSGVDASTLQEYNPELRQSAIPPLKEGEVYSFRMPSSIKLNFDSLFALVKVERGDEIVLADHKVRRGENLWVLARKYGVRIKDIVSINNLQNARYIRPGQVLQIPTNGYAQHRKSTFAETSKSRKIYYTVRYGDTLSHIAKKHYTSVRKIKKWNGLRGDFIRTGQKLIIWKKV